MAKARAKLGYLTYEDMLIKLQNGQLDPYDVIYTRNTKECFIISEDLIPVAVKSKVHCFDNTTEAYKSLNDGSIYAYEGQIISIKVDDVYVAYIVNKNYSGKFYATPLSLSAKDIDYNELGNIPITNLTGTLDKPIMIEDLSTGVYAINGQYRISQNLETTFLSTVSNIFLVERTDTSTVIKKISAYDIVTYFIEDNEVTTTSVATVDMLKDYATIEYVDTKIAALDFITKEEAEIFIENFISQSLDLIVEEKVDEKLSEGIDELIDSRIDAKITEVENDSIKDLFV